MHASPLPKEERQRLIRARGSALRGVGTVAADDACLVVARSAADARKLASELA